MTKSNKQINKESEVSDSENSPAVVTYRIGQLEQVVRDGFKEHNEKLDRLANNFVTTETFESRIVPLEKAKSKNWVFNTLSAVAGAVLLYLVQYTLTH
jgi:hypothetical protein